MGIVIAGMHCSGGDELGRMLALMGLRNQATAHSSSHQRPVPDEVDVEQANTEWLRGLGGNAWAPPLARLRDVSGTVAHPSASIAAVQRWTRASDDWVAVDPRNSLTLPLWDEVAGRPVPVILTVRHPGEVAHQLQVASDVSISAAVALWLAYTIEVTRQVVDRPVLVVDYRRLFTDGPGTMALVAQFLSHRTDLDPDDSHHRWSEAVSTSSGQAQATTRVPEAVGGVVLSEACAIYEELRHLHGATSFAPGAPAASMPRWAEDLLAADNSSWRRDVELGELRGSLAGLAGDADELKRALKQVHARRDELEAALQTENLENAGLRDRIRAADSGLSQLEGRNRLLSWQSAAMEQELCEVAASYLQARRTLEQIQASRSYRWSRAAVRIVRPRSAPIRALAQAEGSAS